MRTHRIAVTTLLLVGTLMAVLAIPALWVNRQVMNTDNWVNTSGQLLEDSAVRGALSAYLVDQLYANVDVAGELKAALPDRIDPLAAPAAGALRNVAQDLTDEILQRPKVQDVWEAANRAAHTVFLKIVKGGGDNIQTNNGQVTLDLKAILSTIAERTGVGGGLAAKIPDGAAQLTVMKSDQLATAQDAANILRPLAILLTLLMAAFYAAAVWVAGPRRRQAVRAVGFSLIAAGLVALIGRRVGGNAITDSLAASDSVKPAVHSVWTIGTSLLHEAATAAVFYGIVFVFAAWLAGATRLATGLRRTLAPYLREPTYAGGGVAAIVLLLVIWGPTPATRAFVPLVILTALLAFGVQMLRRQTAAEFPGATTTDWGAAARSGAQRVRESAARARPAPSNGGGAAPASPSDPIARLERLASLHDRGVLTDAEFEEQKHEVLAGA